MTAPLSPFIMFAFDVRDETEARAFSARLPDWAQRQKYTIVARTPQDAPTLEQFRAMLRNLLEDRFALQAHRETHTGPVNTLVVARTGVTGPGLKPHPADLACLEHESNQPPRRGKPGKPAPVYCGFDMTAMAGGMLHVSMVDVTLPEACTLLGGLGGVLGGRGKETLVDGTGLSGHWDIALEFVPDRNGPTDGPRPDDVSGPTFTGALEKELGLRLKKGTGEVEQLVIDRVAEPTPD